MGHKVRKPRRRSAHSLASGQRSIAISEFFLKNRHLLGFDSPNRALLTVVKEAVDNSLDACEEAGFLPEVSVEIDELDSGRYLVAVEDNGPGIVESQIARIFGKLLYGSKFHELAQSRGQQGLGISAAGMYAQLTTGKPMRIVSRTDKRQPARELLVSIDTARNRPDIHSRGTIDWRKAHGTRVELELEGQYQHGAHSIPLYLKLTAIANPHVSLHLREPDGTEINWERTSRHRPAQPSRIKPHPHGIELGQLIAMLKATPAKRLGKFLREELSQVGRERATEIIERAGKGLTKKSSPRRIARKKAEALARGIAETSIPAPPSDCVVPIGGDGLLASVRHQLPARFTTAITRQPAVYRGNPFVVEVALGYGYEPNEDDSTDVTIDGHTRVARDAATPSDSIRLLRFANRVPLLYQQSHCAMTKAVIETNWRRYGLEQSRGALPRGPLVIVIHLASVWVPFTSESKESIASYPEIEREIELGLQECGRRLATWLRRENKLERELEMRTEIEKYIPYVGEALASILGWSPAQRDELVAELDRVVIAARGET